MTSQKRLDYLKKYRQENKPKIAESKKIWYIKNREEILKKSREKYQENKIKNNNKSMKEYQKNYQKNYREKNKKNKKNVVELPKNEYFTKTKLLINNDGMFII